MKRTLDLIIKIDVLNQNESLIYQMIGKYGSTLPEGVQEDMRHWAKDLENDRLRLAKKLQKEVKI